MSGNIVALQTYNVIQVNYGRNYDTKAYAFVNYRYNINDTYMLIFAKAQQDLEDWFLKHYKEKFNLLYRSNQCYNYHHLKADGPRTRLYVFELKDE